MRKWIFTAGFVVVIGLALQVRATAQLPFVPGGEVIVLRTIAARILTTASRLKEQIDFWKQVMTPWGQVRRYVIPTWTTGDAGGRAWLEARRILPALTHLPPAIRKELELDHQRVVELDAIGLRTADLLGHTTSHRDSLDALRRVLNLDVVSTVSGRQASLVEVQQENTVATLLVADQQAMMIRLLQALLEMQLQEHTERRDREAADLLSRTGSTPWQRFVNAPNERR